VSPVARERAFRVAGKQEGEHGSQAAIGPIAAKIGGTADAPEDLRISPTRNLYSSGPIFAWMELPRRDGVLREHPSKPAPPRAGSLSPVLSPCFENRPRVQGGAIFGIVVGYVDT